MYVVKNITDKPIELAPDVFINPGEQLTYQVLPASLPEGLEVKDASLTLEERKADAHAFDPML